MWLKQIEQASKLVRQTHPHYQQQQNLVQGSVQINKQTADNKVLPEATTDVDALMIPDKTDGNTSDGPDETITQPKNVLPDTTNLAVTRHNKRQYDWTQT